jgi:hypothetical protein
METHKAKRVAVIIEAVMQSRLTDAMQQAGVTGYSILPVLGGSGRSGAWSRDGQVGRGSGMVQVVCIVSPGRASEGSLPGGRTPYRRYRRGRLRSSPRRAFLGGAARDRAARDALAPVPGGLSAPLCRRASASGSWW